MPISVTEGRANRVMDGALDNLSLLSYVVDLVSSEPAMGRESVQKGSLGAITVNDGFSSTASGESVATAALSIAISAEKWINVQFDERQSSQDLNGNYPSELGKNGALTLRSEQDEDLLDHLGFGVASAAVDTFNAAGDSIVSADLRTAIASLATQRGVNQARMMIVASPYQAAKLKELAGNYTGGIGVVQGGGLGVANAGEFDGVPMVQTQGLPGVGSSKSVAYSATSTTGLLTTFTVLAGHGYSAGMPLSASSGLITGSVSSVTATTIVANGSGSAASQTGNLHLAAEVGLVICRDHVYFIPEFEFKVKPASTANTFGDLLKMGSLYGRGGHSGYVKRFLSPRGAL